MEKNEIFQCDICGNLVSLVRKGKGSLKCCGEKMIHLEAKTGDPASEKHLPIPEKKEGGILVKIGKHGHPMVKAHYIGFIELEFGNYILRQELGSGKECRAFFPVDGKDIRLRSYCLIHGLYESD